MRPQTNAIFAHHDETTKQPAANAQQHRPINAKRTAGSRNVKKIDRLLDDIRVDEIADFGRLGGRGRSD
jgi:hypothetical protein